MLTNLIHHLKSTKNLYVKNPEKDFTRERKLSFEKVITCLLGMGGGSLANELMDQFGCDADLVTVSAFIQQRNKLLPSALETLFHRFVEKSECSSLYEGYRLLAVDGSALAVYDGTRRSGTGATVNYARKLGREIIVIDPITRNIVHEGA